MGDFAVHIRELRTVRNVWSWKCGSCTSQNSFVCLLEEAWRKGTLPPYSQSCILDSVRLWCIPMCVIAEARWERAVGCSAQSLHILSLTEPSPGKPQQSLCLLSLQHSSYRHLWLYPAFYIGAGNFEAWSSCLQSWALYRTIFKHKASILDWFPVPCSFSPCFC